MIWRKQRRRSDLGQDRESIKAVVYEVLEDFRSSAFAGEVTEETQLGELGLDSLDLVEMSMAIEEKLGINLPDDTDKLRATVTVRELIDFVQLFS